MSDSDRQYIRAAGIYDPDVGGMDGTVLEFSDGTVCAVRDDVPRNGELVFDTEGYVLPGLVDAHSHASIRPGEGDQIAQMRADPAEQAVRAARNLRADLDAGVTTMRLMAAERYLDVTLARLEREGELDAPRLLPSGVHLTPTGGHGKALTATDGPEQVRDRVRTNYDRGAHHSKYFATGGVSSDSGGLDTPNYTREEVETIVAESHRLGLHVATHAHGGPGATQAIDCGVDTIEHAATLGPAAIDALDGGDQFVVGTFSILMNPEGIEKGDADSHAIMENVREARETVRETWTSLVDRDIPLALGTDSMHGNLYEEMQLLREFGASTDQAIRAATSDAARAAHIDQRAGTLTRGKSADVVVVADDPHETFETLADPVAVFKRGVRQ